MGWIKEYFHLMWSSGSEQGKAMKESQKEMLKKKRRKKK